MADCPAPQSPPATPEFVAWLKSMAPRQLWDTFDQLGALANFIQISGPVITSCSLAFAGGVALYSRIRGKSKDAEIGRLKRRCELLDQQTVEQAQANATLQDKLQAFEAASVETALATAKKELAENNQQKARRTLELWLEQAGPPIAELLQERAKWALGLASGDERSAGLSVARAYAAASECLDPYRVPAYADLAHDLEELAQIEGRGSQSFANALQVLRTAQPSSATNHEVTARAILAVKEAQNLESAGHFGVSLVTIDAALPILTRAHGVAAESTLEANFLKGSALRHLGRVQEALTLVDDVLLGLTRRSGGANATPRWSLLHRHLRGALLEDLGRGGEALPGIIQLADELAQHAAFGPNHWASLSNQHLEATVLQSLGLFKESLAVLDSARTGIHGQELLGPDYLATNEYMRAAALFELDRPLEASASIDSSIAALSGTSRFGEAHVLRISAEVQRATIMVSLGKDSEHATDTARRQIDLMTRNKDFGAEHPTTLVLRSTFASLLMERDLLDEATAEFRLVLQAWRRRGAGDTRRESVFATRRLNAELLHRLGEDKAALAELDHLIGEISSSEREHMALRARSLRAHVLTRLGQCEAALAEAKAVAGEQDALKHSALLSRLAEAQALSCVGRRAEATSIARNVHAKTLAQFGMNAPRTRRAEALSRQIEQQ